MNDACLALPTAPETQTFGVVLHNRASVERSLLSIAKRAARRGLPVPTWTWGAVTTELEKHHVRHEEYTDMIVEREMRVTRIALVLSAAPVRHEGWTFLAALTHLGEGNVVRGLAGQIVPAEYRDASSGCDHCKTNRARRETYVLQHVDGRTVQVGSTCIEDFLGGQDALQIAASAEIAASLRAVGELGENEMSGFGRSGDDSLASYLEKVAAIVRTVGWVSRTAARDDVSGRVIATADLALDERFVKELVVTDEDVAAASAAALWAAEITDEDVARETGDYLHNIRAVARAGYVSRKLFGIGASIVVAHQRALGRARLAAERAARPVSNVHLGTIGAQVTFGLPPVVGKRGKPLKNSPTVLSSEPLVLDFVTGYDTDYGYVTVLKFRTVDGATVVWKSSSLDCPGRGDVGKRYSCWGTVKKHDEYKGQLQTLLTRCALSCLDLDAPEAPASGPDASA